MSRKPTIEPDRIAELRTALSRIPGAEKKSWLLEIYDLRDGEELLAGVLDIKTGRPVRWRPEASSPEVSRG